MNSCAYNKDLNLQKRASSVALKEENQDHNDLLMLWSINDAPNERQTIPEDLDWMASLRPWLSWTNQCAFCTILKKNESSMKRQKVLGEQEHILGRPGPAHQKSALPAARVILPCLFHSGREQLRAGRQLESTAAWSLQSDGQLRRLGAG